MTHIKKTYESFINEKKEEDLWWEKNYKILMDYVSDSPNAYDIAANIDPSAIEYWYQLKPVDRGRVLLDMLSIEELEDELREFDVDGEHFND